MLHFSSSLSDKPYSFTDRSGNTYHYFEKPLFNACFFILMQEFCERLAFYGLTPNLQLFTKEYLGYTDAVANSYVSSFNSILYVTPMLTGILADTFLGVYLTILIFSLVYMLGLVLITIASVPSLSEPWMIHVSLMFLITVGAGGIKSCVNVMGAQQMHPEKHKDILTSFFTIFYAAINLGSIIGGVVTPILVEDVSWASSFVVPLIFFAVATSVFVLGDLMKRYVKVKPEGSAVLEVIKVMLASIWRCGVDKNKKSQGGSFEDSFIEDTKVFARLLPILLVTIPFNMAYNNMTTTFLTQALLMDRDTFGWNMPAAIMQNVDPIGVVIVSVIVDGYLYPKLRQWNMMPSVLVRFCIGSTLGALSLLCATIIEYQIRSHSIYTISIWWQVPQFVFIAAGEIFLISTSYEVAYTHAPSQLKTVASAVNLCFMAVAYAISAALFGACASWLPNFDPNDIDGYIDHSHYDYYYYLLIGICLLGSAGALILIPYYRRIESDHQAQIKSSNSQEPITIDSDESAA
ncbi:hypothetical protein FOL47_006928 [Perkinsus chesapeaki]|uniref:Major facilitator superfamily (MFS) profile domain-containing protein n=1 Tax=Perkinsus chesapeaki TaxID=330153 RepID=A0A7J6LNM5_PERCH|nr:hypothetical protein FOL47_006928 [Perkinsus chesapeaki]